MKKNTNSNIQLNYIYKNKSPLSLEKRLLIIGLLLFVLQILFILILRYLNQSSLTFTFFEIIGLLMTVIFSVAFAYIYLRIYRKKMEKGNPKDLIAPVSENIGEILSKIPCSTLQGNEGVGGILFIGKTGLSFIPNKYFILNPNHKFFTQPKVIVHMWDEVNTVFISSGVPTFINLKNQHIDDRLAIELKGETYFFHLVNNKELDEIVSGINELIS